MAAQVVVFMGTCALQSWLLARRHGIGLSSFLPPVRVAGFFFVSLLAGGGAAWLRDHWVLATGSRGWRLAGRSGLLVLLLAGLWTLGEGAVISSARWRARGA
jgi:hypothetical protein